MWFDKLTMNGIAVALMLAAQSALAADVLPRPDHIVIVMEENKPFGQIIGSKDAPYINALAKRGVLFTNSFGVTHPSQPNYLAFFSGTTHGVSSNICPLDLKSDNLAGVLLKQGLSFVSYSETMPEAGYMGCMYGAYMRKHNPVSNWNELSALNQPFTAFPQDFTKLPTVALVVPDQLNDMHDGSVAQGDAWLKQNVGAYAQWAMTHNSLLIVTWDEDDGSADNRIATMFVGAMVKPGKSLQRINHYTVLRMLSEMYGLPFLGESSNEKSIGNVWQTSSGKH